MAELRIPDHHKSGLTKLVSLSDKSMEQLISAIEDVSPKFFAKDFAAEIATKVPDILLDDITEIVNVLVSLLHSSFQYEIPSDELAHDVVEAMAQTSIQELQLSTAKQDSFRQQLAKFFTIDPLLVVSKAVTVLQSNENSFCSTRIVTDIRRVFGSNPGMAPKAAVIVHSLKLNYHHEGELKDFYIAMDTDDIKTLRDVLERADLKAESLKSIINNAGITYLDPEDTDTK